MDLAQVRSDAEWFMAREGDPDITSAESAFARQVLDLLDRLDAALDREAALRQLVVEAYDEWGEEGHPTNRWRIKAERLDAWPAALRGSSGDALSEGSAGRCTAQVEGERCRLGQGHQGRHDYEWTMER
jgi:hypothetical protein